jgi:hypothetical protein
MDRALMILKLDAGGVEAFERKHLLAFERARDEVIADADRRAPRDMGTLAASIGPDGPARRGPMGVSGAFGSSLRYALMREFGGEIKPVRKRALSWVTKSGIRIVLGPGIKRTHGRRDSDTGELVIFVAKPSVVQRPGGPSNGYQPYLRPAAERFGEYLADHLRALS